MLETGFAEAVCPITAVMIARERTLIRNRKRIVASIQLGTAEYCIQGLDTKRDIAIQFP